MTTVTEIFSRPYNARNKYSGTGLTNFPPQENELYIAAIDIWNMVVGDEQLLISNIPMDTKTFRITKNLGYKSVHSVDPENTKIINFFNLINHMRPNYKVNLRENNVEKDVEDFCILSNN